MANIKIEIHNRSVGKRKEGIINWNISKDDKKDLLRFLEELGLGKVNKGRKITESRQSKYLDSLRTPLEFFNKPTKKLTDKDVEAFEKALSSGVLGRKDGQPYSNATKVDIRRTMKIYFRWVLGINKASKLTDWLDTRDVKKTPDYLKESEIEKLYKSCKNNEQRFLIAMLFDSGARAGEFHNIRYEDIQLPQGNNNFVRLTLKEEYSKTKGRTISLYWKNSLEAVKGYLREREIDGIKSDEPVFKNTYLGARLFLRRLGKKILGRVIYFHLFRHSSATYYANKLNRQELCIRHGWAFSSKMPDVYISRSGMESNELDEKFTHTELGELQRKVSKHDTEIKMKNETVSDLQKMSNKLYKELSYIKAVIAANKVKLKQPEEISYTDLDGNQYHEVFDLIPEKELKKYPHIKVDI